MDVEGQLTHEVTDRRICCGNNECLCEAVRTVSVWSRGPVSVWNGGASVWCLHIIFAAKILMCAFGHTLTPTQYIRTLTHTHGCLEIR